MRAAPALAVAVALALFPSAAAGSTVSLVLGDGCGGDVACSKYGGAPPIPVTTFAGAPGEANRVTVRRDGGELVVRDDGATLEARDTCRSVDAHTARCAIVPIEGEEGSHRVAVMLGDGDDTAAVRDVRLLTTFSGGPGDDDLRGGAQDDLVDGGAGDDRMRGAGGADTLLYGDRTAGVEVDLAARRGGEPGEADVPSGFERLYGGRGDDVLRGSGRAEVIRGGPGSEWIAGRGGDDELHGETGADRLFGEGGDDTLLGDPEQGDGYYTPIIRLRPDRLSGGRGDDHLDDTGGRNVLLGGPGNDVLSGGAGPDRVQAGAGRDRVWTREGGRDSADCGPGRDRIRADRRDARRSCERLWRLPPHGDRG